MMKSAYEKPPSTASANADFDSFHINFTGILLSKEITGEVDEMGILTPGGNNQYKLLTLLPFQMDVEQKKKFTMFPSSRLNFSLNALWEHKTPYVNLQPFRLMRRLQTDTFPVGQRELGVLISEWALAKLMKDAKRTDYWSRSRLTVITAYGRANAAFFESLPLLSVVNFRNVHLKPDYEYEKKGLWLWTLDESSSIDGCLCTEENNRSKLANDAYQAVSKLVKDFAKEDEKEEKEAKERKLASNSSRKRFLDFTDDAGEIATAFKFTKLDEYYYDRDDYEKADRYEDNSLEKINKNKYRKIIDYDPLKRFFMPPERAKMFYRETDNSNDDTWKNFQQGGTANHERNKTGGFFSDVVIVDEGSDIFVKKNLIPLVNRCPSPTESLGAEEVTPM